MKSLYIRYYFVSIISVVIAAQAYGQSYNYLRILRSFPPIPENTLTASKKEVESFMEKLSVINTLLWELESAEKEEERKRENEPSPFSLNNMVKFDAAQEEYELLLNQAFSSIEQFSEYDLELSLQYINIVDSVNIINKPVAAKFKSSNNKDQVYKELYYNRLNAYKNIDAEYRENLRFLIIECEKISPVINKLDNFTFDKHQVSYNKPGLQMLRLLYNSMEQAFSYSVGNGEEAHPYDMNLLW